MQANDPCHTSITLKVEILLCEDHINGGTDTHNKSKRGSGVV